MNTSDLAVGHTHTLGQTQGDMESGVRLAGVVAPWLPARRAPGITTSDALRAE